MAAGNENDDARQREQPPAFLNEQQRNKAARKQRKRSERAAHRNLDQLTTEAIESALALAPQVAGATAPDERDRAIPLDLASESEAQFIRKRVNDALQIGEWLDDVRVWVWKAGEHHRPPQTEQGRRIGLELRIERAPRD